MATEKRAHYPGQRLCFDGALCTVRYVGPVAATTGTWLGVEWDDPLRGKHAGEHKSVRYFACRSRSPAVASFVRPTRPDEPARGFLAALRDKYRLWDAELQSQAGVIRLSARKTVEELGYEKISRRQARLDEQRLIVLDGARVAVTRTRPGVDGHAAADDDDDGWNGDGRVEIRKSCPAITDLDLSRNLLEEMDGVMEVCMGLKELKTLKLSGNRFRSLISLDRQHELHEAVGGVVELGLADTLLTWPEVVSVAGAFPALTTLNAAANQFDRLPLVEAASLRVTLTSLNLEHNDFTALSQLGSLAELANLKSLVLKGNNITEITAEGDATPSFPPSLRFIDLSYNKVSSWAFVDALPSVLPGLAALRISHNPIYETGETDDGRSGVMGSLDEAFMTTVGRIGSLTSLNLGPVTSADRTDAEMFYLSRIARQLAATTEAAEADVLKQHPRYHELCVTYGTPDVVRRVQTNPDCLDARLVNVKFRLGVDQADAKDLQKTVAIPKSFDTYTVRAIAARLFGMAPLDVKLVWVTGEWDPVGELEGQQHDAGHAALASSEVASTITTQPSSRASDLANQDAVSLASAPHEGASPDTARWVRREVELRWGPRQLGFCVDGPEATIRVETLNSTGSERGAGADTALPQHA